jgi:HPr kinase/phosphorylase
MSIPVTKIIERFDLEKIYLPDDIKKKAVDIVEVYRPGLQLAGYLDGFSPERVQMFGKTEMNFLGTMSKEERLKRLDAFMFGKMPCIIISSSLDVYDEIIEVAQIYKVPILRTYERTSVFLAMLISYLNLELAERMTIHGELLELYGVGILITGVSGVGKSETALELVKRGHRLIADDVVELRKVSQTTLLGTSPEIIRHFMELRGIGIVDIKGLFGAGSVKDIDSIDMVINMERWDETKRYDRIGVEEELVEYLGIKIPSITLPIMPGRNVPILIEVAAMNFRQKKMGYNAAKEMYERVNKNFAKYSKEV